MEGQPEPEELKVLLAMARMGGSGSYSAIKKSVGKEVAMFLGRLVSKGCLFQDEGRNRYYLPHPLAGHYLLVKYRSKAK